MSIKNSMKKYFEIIDSLFEQVEIVWPIHFSMARYDDNSVELLWPVKRNFSKYGQYSVIKSLNLYEEKLNRI